MEDLYSGAAEVAHYTCYRASGPIEIDGDLTKPVWANAPRSPRFVDVVNGRPALLDTRAAALWDDDALYIGFWLDEPSVEAADDRARLARLLRERHRGLHRRRRHLLRVRAERAQHDLRGLLHLAGRLSSAVAASTCRSSTSSTVEASPSAATSTAPAATFWRGAHPRGLRWAFPDWDFPGLKTAVRIDGTLNDSTDVDRGWTVELAFPWSGMTWLANGRSLPPADGDTWRLLFARYQKLNLLGQEISTGWTWNRVGSIDNHAPECFTVLHFRDEIAR